MLENLSKTREFWHSQIKCASPPLSENEQPEDLPAEGTSEEVVVVMPKTISEESSMSCSDENELQTCPVDGGDADTCSLQSSTDSLANVKRYTIISERGDREK